MEGESNGRVRVSPLEIDPEQFRLLGHELIDRIAKLLESLPTRPVTRGESPLDIRKALDADRGLPSCGEDPGQLLHRAADLLFDHSLFNGHPRFWGYITSSATPIGALGELLAAAVNPNVGAWPLSPMASEIEAQTIRWIAEMLGYPQECGGLLVSGGNMANIVGFLAARQAKAGRDVRTAGLGDARLRVYCSKETHTWVQKAADIAGMGTDAIRWIATNDRMQIDVSALRQQIEADRAAGERPILVVGNAGTVSTVSCGRRLWRNGGDCSRGFSTVCRPWRSGLNCDGSSQVALCAARGRMCAGTQPREATRYILIPSAVLPL
jgi:hypothetical protein